MKIKKDTTEKPATEQPDRDAKGRFAEGNTLGDKFPPGVSGNPAGSPIRRTNLWVWFCKYMLMTDQEIDKLDKEKLTQAQQTALKVVKDMKDGKYTGSVPLARYTIDRDEGRAVEHLVIGSEDALSDEDCEDIRQALIQNAK